MKKLCALTLCLMMTPIAAFAIPMKWHDEINLYGIYLQKGDSHTYTHDINDDGFYAGSDWIWDYKLIVGIHDDKDPYNKRKEKIRVDLPGYFGDRTYKRFNASGVYGGGWSFAGWASLNYRGLLDVTVKSLKGDFYLKSSKLWAKGHSHHDKPTDVPEPGSLALLGLGLVGLGLARRRLISKK